MDFERNLAEMFWGLDCGETIVDSFNSATHDQNDLARIQFVLSMGESLRVPFIQKKPFKLHKFMISKEHKSAKLSTSHGLKGNDNYQKKLYLDAISCYSKSILEGEGESLALAYANRSIMFYCTADWLHSLRDIQLALDHGYPKHLEYKLRERQGNCWLKLGNVNQAFISYNLAKDLLVGSSHKDDQLNSKLTSIVTKINKLGSVKEVDVSQLISDVKVIEEDIMKQRRLPPELFGGKNPLMPCASSSIKLSSSSDRGRFFISTEDLQPGATILVEKPFVSILKEEFKETHCHHCFHWTPGPVPCLRCSQVGFCSTICRDEAWASYHKSECGFTDLLFRTDGTGTALMALRTVLMVDREVLLNAPKQLPSDGDIYDSTNYATIHHLVGHTANRSAREIFCVSVLAYYVVCLVRGEVDVELSAALLRLFHSYSCNAYTVYQMLLPPPSSPIGAIKLSVTEIGGAVMSVSSLVNHSCNPNITRNCYGNVLAVRVISPIKCGDEILCNYGPLYCFESKKSRQSKMKEDYCFACRCQACEEDWPQMKDIPSLAATQPALFSALLLDTVQFYHYQCFYPSNLDDLKKWAAKFVGYLNKMDGGKPIRRPIREYTNAQELLKRCYDHMATVSPKVLKPPMESSSEVLNWLKQLNLSK